VVDEAAAYCRYLAMCGWVAVRPSEIAPAREDLSVAHNYGAEREITLPSFIQGNAHEPFIVG